MSTAPPPPPRYVGRAVCSECHPKEEKRWRDSDHDLAMQEASPETVLGDFDDARFTHHGVTSRFFRRDRQFFVETEGPDGQSHEFPVRYTFGVRPLQQYLLPLPGGRLQALTIAWDSRPKSDGGQRWFDLLSDARLHPGDPRHWTGRGYNWNHMCASCHSTGLIKGYDAPSGTYRTRWSEIDVSCEACHGQGSRHVSWARGETPAQPHRGLIQPFKKRAAWTVDPQTGHARVQERDSSEIETCARCHSHRHPLQPGNHAGRPLLDGYQPSLLHENRYHADGQILDEVFVYGSFVQSKMYQAGVTCSDCHDPHSLKLRAQGNALCAGCHSPTTYDHPSHHFHEKIQCVDCHMPAHTYMGVDPRRDHSLRIPRPDLSARLGAPDACTGCHTQRTQQWAADALSRLGKLRKTEHFGEALHAGRTGAPGATPRLIRLIEDRRVAGIARATAVTLLQRRPSPETASAIARAAVDPDPLVRLASARSLSLIPPEKRQAPIRSLRTDPLLGIRFEIAREERQKEYIQRLAQDADQPEALLHIGLFHQRRNERTRALEAYRRSISLDPRFYPARIHLAALLDPVQSEVTLREAVRTSPKSGAPPHALGLLLVRNRQPDKALPWLERAASLEPDQSRYAYAYALGLREAGQQARAIALLRETLARHPNDEQILFALATMLRDRGLHQAARNLVDRLVLLAPWNPTYRALREQLQSR